MRSEIVTNTEPAAPEYPCLMEHRQGTVVLFLPGGTGIALYPQTHPLYGYPSEGWTLEDQPDAWKPFQGQVILSNGDPE